MKVVFGGAFNPVTNAHIEVYKYLSKKIPNTEFIFLPVSSAYTKSELASNIHRVEMLELALNGFENVIISELEIEDNDFLGSYQTLIRLADGYDDDICFVVGADNLYGMENWINIEGILSEFKIIVLGRNGINIKEVISNCHILKKHQSSFIIFEEFKIDISSTGFRESFDQSLVNKKVYEYIIENDLYRGEDDV